MVPLEARIYQQAHTGNGGEPTISSSELHPNFPQGFHVHEVNKGVIQPVRRELHRVFAAFEPFTPRDADTDAVDSLFKKVRYIASDTGLLTDLEGQYQQEYKILSATSEKSVSTFSGRAGRAAVFVDPYLQGNALEELENRERDAAKATEEKVLQDVAFVRAAQNVLDIRDLSPTPFAMLIGLYKRGLVRVQVKPNLDSRNNGFFRAHVPILMGSKKFSLGCWNSRDKTLNNFHGWSQDCDTRRSITLVTSGSR